jgi:hypothetical protein
VNYPHLLVSLEASETSVTDEEEASLTYSASELYMFCDSYKYK